MGLTDYIEKHFGGIEDGLTLKEAGFPHLQVVRINDKPFQGLTTFMTLGASRKDLYMPNDRFCKQEFVFSTYTNENDFEDVASVLLIFAEMVIQSKNAVLRGEVIGPGESFIKGGTCNCFYSTSPIFFGDDLVYHGFDIPVIFTWLIPLLEEEASEVRKIGWGQFEDILVYIPVKVSHHSGQSEPPDKWRTYNG